MDEIIMIIAFGISYIFALCVAYIIGFRQGKHDAYKKIRIKNETH